jgi:hypothetical protein
MSEPTEGIAPERSLVKNAADEEQVEAGKKKAKRRATREADDLRLVLGTAPGRRVLWRLMGYAGLYESSVDVLDSHAQMAYREGKKDVARRILAGINAADPAAYVTMQQEAANQTD